jgi:hypothetical protein
LQQGGGEELGSRSEEAVESPLLHMESEGLLTTKTRRRRSFLQLEQRAKILSQEQVGSSLKTKTRGKTDPSTRKQSRTLKFRAKL